MATILTALGPVARSLSRSRGFTVTAGLTLALGIGANIAVLSATYRVLVRPLPYRNAEQIVLIRAEARYEGTPRPTRVSVESDDVSAWTQSSRLLRASAFYAPSVSALIGSDGTEVLNTAIVSGGFFAEMDGPVIAGRPLQQSDEESPVTVISERLARRLFGSAESAIGRVLRFRPDTYTVVGVARGDFDFPGDPEAWLPAGPSCCSFEVVARLPPGVSVESASVEARRLFQALPSSQGNAATLQVHAARLADEEVAPAREGLLVLSAAAALLLVAACGNVVNLILARNAGRKAEFAIRRSLGAPTGRLISQLALEGAVLSLVGAALGLAFAGVLLPLMTALAAGSVPRLDGSQIDFMSVLIAITLATAATVGATIEPALRVMSIPATPMRAGDSTRSAGGARRLQRAMCVVQVAMAVTLLIGAAVLHRGLLNLLQVDLGVNRDHVVTASINMAFGERADDSEILARIERLLEGVKTTPGVRAAGVGVAIPPHLARMHVTLRREGAGVDYRAAAVPATPGYFSALRLRLREGRLFTETDTADAPPVMVMTEETARRFFGANPIGQTMSVPRLRNGKGTSVAMTLVGIVANVKYGGLASPSDDVIYVPFSQQPWRSAFLVVQTIRPPAAFAATLRKAIARAEPNLVTGDVATLDDLVSGQVAGPRFRAVLLSVIACLALCIAAVGLYGMVACSVAQRTREMGIRIAIGATARNVITLILRETLTVGVLGIVVGLGLALYAVRLLTGLAYGVAPTDPTSFLLGSAGLLLVITLAGYVPARRASRLAPVDALRAE